MIDDGREREIAEKLLQKLSALSNAVYQVRNMGRWKHTSEGQELGYKWSLNMVSAWTFDTSSSQLHVKLLIYSKGICAVVSSGLKLSLPGVHGRSGAKIQEIMQTHRPQEAK